MKLTVLRLKNLSLSLVFGAVLLGTSLQTCWAYIPPSAFILKTWANRHSAVKLVRVRSTITAFKDGKPSEVHFKETSFYGPALASFKSFAQDDEGKTLFALDKLSQAASVFTKLVLSADATDLGRALKEKGIPIRLEEDLLALLTEDERIHSEVESLGRWKNVFAWIVGADSQLWFQKDSFQPLRMMIPSEALGEAVEVQMEEFGGSFAYPRLVTLLKKKTGEILLQSQLTDIANVSEASIPSGIFNRKPSESSSFKPNGDVAQPTGSSAVMELVKTYYNVLR